MRVGYYVNNEYEDPELREEPPSEPQFAKLIRTIATDQPRVTKFKINWDSANAPATTATEEQPAAQATDTIVTYFNGQDVEMSAEDTTSSNKNEITTQQTNQPVEI